MTRAPLAVPLIALLAALVLGARASPPPTAPRPPESSLSGRGGALSGSRCPSSRHVAERDACLRCACAGGALRCARARCAALPAPPPPRCRLLQTPRACCPQLHCPEGVSSTEVSPARAHPGDEPRAHRDATDNVFPVCVEDGAVFAAGSALPARESCERCACAGGRRRCERAGCAGVRDGDSGIVSSSLPTAELPDTSPTTPGMADDEATSEAVTDQPDGSVRIVVNGSVDCTAELSTAPLAPELQTAGPDVVTEPETFTINVTSSLATGVVHPEPSVEPAGPPDTTSVTNISNNTEKDYEYEDVSPTLPTLPPSLPNLKIIPFVAADAVVEEKTSPSNPSPYPAQERDDKFPVYYPAVEPASAPAQRRKYAPHPAQYPVYASDRSDTASPSEGPGPLRLVPAAPPGRSTPARSDPTTPAHNLFSPPIQTEGGFLPKGPGPASEYLAVGPAAPPPAPHLTTSMPLDSGDPGSECWGAVSPPCARCVCVRRTLHCTPHDCPAPAHPTPPPATLSGRNESTASPLRPGEQPVPVPEGVLTFEPPHNRAPPPRPSPAPAPGSPDTTATLVDDVTYVEMTSPHTGYVQNFTEELETTAVTSVPTSTASTTPEHEYEDEEDDGGFSFGSVFKLLLSDTYDAIVTRPTTAAPAPDSVPSTHRTAPPKIPSTHRTVPPKIPSTHRTAPPKIPSTHTTAPPKILSTHRTAPPTIPSMNKTVPPTVPSTHGTIPPMIPITYWTSPSTVSSMLGSAPPAAPIPGSVAPAPGGLRLAGCNIYGRMYRPGRVISELSAPCRECRCTELGVQCAALPPPC